MLENIVLSIQGIWSHKMRSFLTMLGIIIGIASIISIVSTIKGTNEQIKKNLIGSGNNAVNITLYEDEGEFNADYGSDYSNISTVSEELLEEMRNVEGVESVATYVKRYYADRTFYGDSEVNAQMYGIDNSYFKTAGYQIIQGRGFVESDFKDFHKVIILDKETSDSIFTDRSPIGETIEIKGEPFIVIGVVDEIEKFEPVIQSLDDYLMFEENSSGIIFMPDTSWPIAYSFDEPQHVLLKTSNTDVMSTAGK
ncbi:MAG TPA: ABC transporter permease, partial [Candidatus Merdenecus merdavium]|nr:ABC transporter permease [Candidatus Merdenecus merdavium]